MPKPSRVPRRRLYLVQIAAICVTVALLSWSLVRDPGRREFFDAASLATAVIGSLFAVLGLRSNARDHAQADSSPEQHLQRLADDVCREMATEIALLKLSGADFIKVGWALNLERSDPEISTLFDCTEELVQRPRVRNVSTLAEDWRAGRSRLSVILGARGAGKSVTAMLLVHQLLDRRDHHDGPIPVLFRIGDWNPETTAFPDWITQQLADRYQLPEHTTPEGNYIAKRLLPVLDGFDEIPAPRRGRAIERLREAMDATRFSVVLTSRVEEFDAALDKVGRPLATMSVITLHPVSPEQAKTYLKAGRQGAAHWAAVLEQLDRPDSPVAEALQTPLLVYLCSEVYKRKENKPERRELERFADRAEVEQHLVARFLPLRYADKARSSDTNHDATRALQYLRFIAHHMNRTGTSQFAWWHLHRSLNRRTLVAVYALVSWTVVWLADTVVDALGVGLGNAVADVLISAAIGGLAVGLVYGLVLRRADFRAPTDALLPEHLKFDGTPEHLKFDGTRIMKALPRWLALGLMFGLIVGSVFQLADEAEFGLMTGLLLGLAFGLVGGSATGLTSPQTPTRLALLGPEEVLLSARNAAITRALAVGLVLGFTGGLMVGLEDGLGAGLAYGLVYGLAGVLLGIPVEGSWLSFRLAQLILAVPGRHRLPFRLMNFLQDAHQRGILRQLGATYEFRHEALKAALIRSTRSSS